MSISVLAISFDAADAALVPMLHRVPEGKTTG
jgi:hypothetical protein